MSLSPRDLIRRRLSHVCIDTSVAMGRLHDELHGTEGGWMECDQEPCDSVGLLMAELTLVLLEVQGGLN